MTALGLWASLIGQRFVANWCGWLFCLSLLAGCNSVDPAGEAVSGKITYQGAPLNYGQIEFVPTGNEGTFSGAQIADGVYSIPPETGLQPGQYRVGIYSEERDEGTESEFPGESTAVARERIPAKYNTQSSITFEVKMGAENTFNYDIP